MDKKFKMLSKANLRGRTSTITNAFAIAITPYINPSKQEVREMYEKLKIDEGQCAYCLKSANSADHIMPLVTGGLPTGYITNIHNLIPCCAACNSSKGKKNFKDWYLSASNVNRLASEGMSKEEIIARFKIIEDYMKDIGEPLNYREILGDEIWAEYLERKGKLLTLLRDNQDFCDKLNKIIMNKISEGRSE